jgi:hypothetical protein
VLHHRVILLAHQVPAHRATQPPARGATR